MTCGNCNMTDGCCYTSLPPKVKCNVTGEFHCYDDECNCEAIRASKVDEVAQLKMMLSQPLLTIDYNDLTDTSTAFCKEELADFNMTDVEVGSTACLVCGERVGFKPMDGGPKICKTCKKTILYIKEKFSKELENYEV